MCVCLSMCVCEVSHTSLGLKIGISAFIFVTRLYVCMYVCIYVCMHLPFVYVCGWSRSQSVIIVFITLQNQSAPSQMTIKQEILYWFQDLRLFLYLSMQVVWMYGCMRVCLYLPVYISMCVCMRHTHTCIHIHTRIHIHKCIHIHTCIHIHACIHTSTCMHTHAHKHTHTHAHTYTHTYMQTHAYTRMHTHALTSALCRICMEMTWYAYTHTHAYTHMHTHTHISPVWRCLDTHTHTCITHSIHRLTSALCRICMEMTWLNVFSGSIFRHLSMRFLAVSESRLAELTNMA